MLAEILTDEEKFTLIISVKISPEGYNSFVKLDKLITIYDHVGACIEKSFSRHTKGEINLILSMGGRVELNLDPKVIGNKLITLVGHEIKKKQ